MKKITKKEFTEAFKTINGFLAQIKKDAKASLKKANSLSLDTSTRVREECQDSLYRLDEYLDSDWLDGEWENSVEDIRNWEGEVASETRDLDRLIVKVIKEKRKR